ncbi:Hsp20 family protein [Prosthecochloris sp.]|uniref:Hsp20 family protein n=1 Tax=Prosthecochloris sp. TaxID=290513 RepID=UPI002580A08C|nr:Hsp20 family protein [Prosthecochloris sp.]
MSQKKKKEDFDVDFGFGSLKLGGLFDGLDKLVDAAAKLKEMGGEYSKEGEIDLSHLKKGMKGVFGVTVKTGIGGEGPVVESFGNIRKTKEGPKVEEEREPLSDIFDEDDGVIVMLEMPGVAKEDIAVTLEGDILEVIAQSQSRKYRKELLLPSAVQAETIAWTYQNGVLEVTVKKG